MTGGADHAAFFDGDREDALAQLADLSVTVGTISSHPQMSMCSYQT